jgi:hypothetical protein
VTLFGYDAEWALVEDGHRRVPAHLSRDDAILIQSGQA